MRLDLLVSAPIAGFLLSGQAPPPLSPPLPAPPEARITNLGDLHDARCAQVIRQVRDASGQPALQRGPATGADGYLIAAVDRRVDGCPVMQMHGDANDLRPLPEAGDDFRLRPAGE